MTQEAQLKVCPFCGGEAEVDPQEDYEWGGYFVSCNNFDCSSSNHGESPEEAIAAWNTRIESGVVAELVKAADAIERYLRETPHHNATQAAALRAALAKLEASK